MAARGTTTMEMPTTSNTAEHVDYAAIYSIKSKGITPRFYGLRVLYRSHINIVSHRNKYGYENS
jgi:hypothetical protein